mgnify:CR=1 FL=1
MIKKSVYIISVLAICFNCLLAQTDSINTAAPGIIKMSYNNIPGYFISDINIQSLRATILNLKKRSDDFELKNNLIAEKIKELERVQIPLLTRQIDIWKSTADSHIIYIDRLEVQLKEKERDIRRLTFKNKILRKISTFGIPGAFVTGAVVTLIILK